MSETANVRLVRCPKCDTLLPEVPYYSVHQCSGCGAVLRARNKAVDLETFSEKSNEYMVGDAVEEFCDNYEKMNGSESRMIDLSDGSDSARGSRASSSSRAERRRILRGGAENYRSSLMNDEESWDLGADQVQDRSGQTKSARGFEDSTRYNENLERLGRSVHGRMDAEVMRYTKEGPSNFSSRLRNRSDIDGFSNVVEDRAELLRQMDELKEKLSRSGHLVEKGKDKVSLNIQTASPDPYASDDWYHDSSSGVNRASNQYSNPEAQFKRPTDQNRYAESPHLMHREEMVANGFYPQRYSSSQSRYHVQNPLRYQEPRSHAYTSGRYMDDGMEYMDTMEPYPTNIILHHPSCSCYQCFNKRLVSDNYSDTSHDNPGSFGSRDYNHQISNPSLRSRNHMRFLSDVNTEVDGFTRRRPRRVQLVSSGKSCRPIAGGAPFLACSNCSELLVLSKKVVSIKNARKKMRCGACSTLIVFTVSIKKLVFEIEVEATDTFEKNDYDDSHYDYHSMDREFGQVSVNCETPTTAEDDLNSGDLARKDKGDRPLAGSNLQIEYSNKFHRRGRYGEGGRSGDDEELPNKTKGKQMLREESSATEITLSSNEYSITGTTFDSSDASKGARSRASAVAGSFFTGISEDSYRSDCTVEEERDNVTVVNGHLIPDRLIKKAEKLAGTIQPGNYWYDFRAGFWGALGGPCLGIIPPFIEQFNYPMPDHCAGGNTGVLVNGRELSQKDLKLLGSRGLPTDNDRAYIVEISGRVLDEETGEELQSLGKLAPTVEKNKRGFGMRDPNVVAPSPR